MKKLLLLIFTIVLTAFSYSASLKERIARLSENASEGDSAALYHLSTLYEYGYDSIARDSVLADSLLRKSAEAGYAPAQNYLGFKLYSHSSAEGKYWIKKAADGGELKATANLGFLLLREDSVVTPEAVELLEKASEGGVPTAMATLADLYREGRGVEADTLRAEELYLQATGRGLKDAEKKLMAMNLNRYRNFSPEEALAAGRNAAKYGAETVAFSLYQRATDGEIPRAYTLLGDAYASAKGTDYNYDLAVENYIKGALGGDAPAQFILAELLEIFPDALLDSTNKLPAGLLPHSTLDIQNPQFWYDAAASAGITSAEEAARELRK